MKTAALGLAAALLAAPALAQPLASPGVPNSQAVNPAPGATRPFLGHPKTFYDPAQRLQDIDARAAALPPGEQHRVSMDVQRIHAFADQQRARHGGALRDWDRERMTRMMNDLVRKYPELKG
ncbi:MAG: hypothetical protein INR64_11385 [Caulobacteraceae bacterium]|nr:hypothetical protein [Caulobacter sp.]